MPYGQVTCFTQYPELKDSTRLQIVININNSEVEHKDVAPLLRNLYKLCEHDTSHLLVKKINISKLVSLISTLILSFHPFNDLSSVYFTKRYNTKRYLFLLPIQHYHIPNTSFGFGRHISLS